MAAIHLFEPGHTACAGCGQAIGARLVLEAAGKNTIVVNNTGCLEVFSSKAPETAWETPWIHSLFENAAAVASGVEAACRFLGNKEKVNIIAQGGDGSTADIGFGAISGMLERGHDILYVCYDNEAYMNTGVQRSGLTPFDANTTTSPSGRESFGNLRPKKDLISIAVAHHIPYAASASIAYPLDIQKKVKKAFSIKGAKYIQVFVPCPLGWRHEPFLTPEVAKLAVETCLFPLLEYENGELSGVKKIKDPQPVEEYLKLQKRFAHLFKAETGKEQIKKIQEIADNNIKKFNLKG